MDWDAISGTLPDWTTAQRLLRRGLSFYLPTVASFALWRADMFILVRIAPTAAIGLYAVAQAIALGQIGAVSPFVQVGFSAVAGETEPRKALQTLARHFRLAQLAVVSIGLLAAAVTPWLIRLMFGAQFSGAVTTAYLLIGATVLWGMEQVLEQGLRAADHPRPGIVSNLLGLAVLVGLGDSGVHALRHRRSCGRCAGRTISQPSAPDRLLRHRVEDAGEGLLGIRCIRFQRTRHICKVFYQAKGSRMSRKLDGRLNPVQVESDHDKH